MISSLTDYGHQTILTPEMKLSKWLEARGRGAAAQLARDAEVDYSTIHRVKGGEILKDYMTAKRIADATGGEVTVKDLCEPGDEEGAAA